MAANLWLSSSASKYITVGGSVTLTAYLEPSTVSSSITAYRAKIMVDGSLKGSAKSWSTSGTRWQTSCSYTFNTAGTYEVGIALCNSSGSYLSAQTGTITVYVEAEEEYTVTVKYYDTGLQATNTSEGSITVRSSGFKSYSGYSFAGWGTSLNSTNVVYDGGETLYAGSSSDKTYNLYAIYQKSTTIYCYYGDHTNPSTNLRTRYDWKVQRTTSSILSTTTLNLSLPTFSASTFNSTSPNGVSWTPLGWRTDTTPGPSQISAGTMPDANNLDSSTSAYYAVYSRTVTISYNANGGSGTTSASTGTAYYNSGSGASPASITLKNGSTCFTAPTNRSFDHWDLGYADDSGTNYASGDILSTCYDSTMYAIWSSVMPALWKWTSTIGGNLTIKTDSAGVKYVTPLTASEWNNFLDRVCEWITYKNAAYYPTYYQNARATAGTAMTASQASYCVRLMAPLYPPVDIPSAPNANSPITAAFINGLANSLNSLRT